MPRKAQHIARAWFAAAMERYPGGRKAVSEALDISQNRLSEYVIGTRRPRPERAIALGLLLGFDGLHCFLGGNPEHSGQTAESAEYAVGRS